MNSLIIEIEVNDILIPATVEFHFLKGESPSQHSHGCSDTLEIESVTNANTGETILIDENQTLQIEKEILMVEKANEEYARYERNWSYQFS